ncbi:MAG: amidase [Halanaeroarchaeum sp.]
MTEESTAREQAGRLSLETSDETIRRALDDADALAAGMEALEEGTDAGTERGVPGDDEYDALLRRDPEAEGGEGPLADVQVAVKDNVAVANLRMTCGSEAFEHVPPEDASVVARLRAGGAEIVGKTNMDAFAFGPSGEFSDFAQVANPIHPGRVPGGSSSGSGAAVAGGIVDVALGSDTGGSVRIPAACTGVVGAKPTHGIVPRDGFVAFAPSLDTIGPIASSVGLAATALDVMVGPSAADPSSRDRPPEPSFEEARERDEFAVGVPESFYAVTDDSVATAVRERLEQVPDVVPETVELPLGAIEEAYLLLGATEFVWYLDQTGVVRGQGTDYSAGIRRALADVKAETLGEHMARRVLPAATLDAETDGESYRRARRTGMAFTGRVRDALAGVDVLVTPTIRTPPPAFGAISTTEEMMTLLGNTAPFNVSGNPAVTVPVGEVDGLPASAQVVAPRYGDFLALAVAERLTRNEGGGATPSFNR